MLTLGTLGCGLDVPPAPAYTEQVDDIDGSLDRPNNGDMAAPNQGDGTRQDNALFKDGGGIGCQTCF